MPVRNDTHRVREAGRDGAARVSGRGRPTGHPVPWGRDACTRLQIVEFNRGFSEATASLCATADLLLSDAVAPLGFQFHSNELLRFLPTCLAIGNCESTRFRCRIDTRWGIRNPGTVTLPRDLQFLES